MEKSTIYQIFVPSFCDTNGDGIGDLNGIIQKLEYLSELGIEAIWLSPIHPSQSYHKYDVLDYYGVDSKFGTMQDFENVIYEAKQRGIDVILDLVINHTSVNHPWFLASTDPRSAFRSFYIWKSKEEIAALKAEKRNATADSQELNPWHTQVSNTEKYYGMFWSGMPDLNLDHEPLVQEIFKMAKFWLAKGVAGFRLDAAKHIFPPWQEELILGFWKRFKQEIQLEHPDAYLIGEVWTFSKEIAPYFEALDINFNFDLAQNMIAQLRGENVHVLDSLKEARVLYAAVNENYIDGIFLSNHDQERIGSALSYEKLKAAATLLLTLPGLAFMYYGEEIGMRGKKPDNRIREAFLWDKRELDSCRTNWQKPKYNTDSQVKPLALQRNDAQSLFNHYKQLIAIRKSYEVFRTVKKTMFEILELNANTDLIAFVRGAGLEKVAVIQNMGSKSLSFIFPLKIESIIFKSMSVSIKENYIEIGSYEGMILKIT